MRCESVELEVLYSLIRETKLGTKESDSIGLGRGLTQKSDPYKAA